MDDAEMMGPLFAVRQRCACECWNAIRHQSVCLLFASSSISSNHKVNVECVALICTCHSPLVTIITFQCVEYVASNFSRFQMKNQSLLSPISVAIARILCTISCPLLAFPLICTCNDSLNCRSDQSKRSEYVGSTKSKIVLGQFDVITMSIRILYQFTHVDFQRSKIV